MARAGIARMIPHQGNMCLLDGVLHWDAAVIRCTTATHTCPDHPMRHDGRLGILCGVEYAAQAMALHGALSAVREMPPRTGYLATLRALTWAGDRLDTLAGTLVVEAERLHGEASRVIYSFALRHDDRTVMSGRAAVVLDDAAP